MKIVSIVGKKNTGKTSLTVKVIEELTKRGYNVASIKHSHHSIEMDKENTDTWKHKQAGANLVVGVGSTTFFNARQEMDLNRILFLLKHIDEIRQGSLTIEDLDEVHSYLSIDGNVVGLNRFVSDYLKQSVIGVINTLNLNDYGVEDIGKIELIVPNKKAPQNPIDAQCSVLINDENLEINEFTTKIVSNSIKAMVNSIKTEDNVKKIDVEISDINNGNLTDSEIVLKTNNHDVEINKFTQGILKETIYAIINSLELDDEEIHGIKINVEE